ncbi:hypothetical protein [Streptococcus marmotae]|uniref:hypothetical protein n=1 Tax=Streptococcus marmotae TaxID=1825069 RepID=UPI0008325731|nr:hypothetical protein [Streptococcus marmotae]
MFKIKNKTQLKGLLSDPCIWLIAFGIFGFKYLIISSVITIIFTIFVIVGGVILLMMVPMMGEAEIEMGSMKYGGGSYGRMRAFQDLVDKDNRK